jgi:hypothetical protein
MPMTSSVTLEYAVLAVQIHSVWLRPEEDTQADLPSTIPPLFETALSNSSARMTAFSLNTVK